MKARRRLALAALGGLLAAGWSGAPRARAAAETPEALIERLSTEALDVVNNDPALRAGDTQRLRELIDTRLMPHVDFRRMTAAAVGVAWRQATPEQRDRLEQGFKALLVRILSGALEQARASGSLARARGRQVVLLPQRAPADATELTVRTQLRGDGEPVPLDYRLEKTGDAWKIVDVNVLGVWMVSQYRNEFAPVLRERGIDGLIDALSRLGQASPAPAK